MLALDRSDERICRGVARFASEHEWLLEDCSEYSRWIPKLPNWKGDGIIANPGFSLPVQPLTQLIRYTRVPCVSLQAFGSFLGSARVWPDCGAIGRQAAEHLASQGFTRFGFVTFSDDQRELELFYGFSNGVKECGGTAELISFADLKSRIRNLSQPIGLLAPSDRTGSAVVSACLQERSCVSGEVGVVGVGNDSTICTLSETCLSSVDCDLEVLGCEAAKSLGELMHGRRPAVESLFIEPKGVVGRGSTAVVARDESSGIPQEAARKDGPSHPYTPGAGDRGVRAMLPIRVTS